MERCTSRLTQMSVLNQRDLRSLTKYQVILAREQFRRNPPSHLMVQLFISVFRLMLWIT